MPLTTTVPALAALIVAQMNATMPLQPTGDSGQNDTLAQQRVDFADALAQAITQHIVTNAQVIVQSVSGVTTGPSVSGPGTGTIL
jgi:hypothetical protein